MFPALSMPVLYLFASIRQPFLDTFFATITELGEATVFIAVALLMLWCVDKYAGYFLMSTGLLGITLNQWLKVLFRVPRPWVLDPEFKIVEKARAGAEGYSFPSGHTQNAFAALGAPAAAEKPRFRQQSRDLLQILGRNILPGGHILQGYIPGLVMGRHVHHQPQGVPSLCRNLHAGASSFVPPSFCHKSTRNASIFPPTGIDIPILFP